MEKTATTKTKSKIFSFLPQTAFQNHPFSPGRDHNNNNNKRSDTILHNKFKAGANNGGKAWSGPIISMIPAEARIKSKSGRSFDAQEPTSPKISCMGQIKHKKISKCKFVPMTPQPPEKEKKSKRSGKRGIRSIFGGGGKKSDDHSVKKKVEATIIPEQNAPVLGQMKRFASSREALVDFDWKYYSERDDSDDEEDEVIVPHSAPMMIGGGVAALEPRKEVNLWKRRTMDPPRPLQLNTIR